MDAHANSLVEVGNHSEESAEVVSDLLHLLFEVCWLLGWEVLQGLGHRCEFSDKNEHVLGEVVRESLHGACIRVGVAIVHQVESRSLEFASTKVLHDFSSIREEADILLNVSDVLEDAKWVLEKVGVDSQVGNSLLVKAFVVSCNSSFVERFGESLVPSSDTFHVPHSSLVRVSLLNNGGGLKLESVGS